MGAEEGRGTEETEGGTEKLEEEEGSVSGEGGGSELERQRGVLDTTRVTG